MCISLGGVLGKGLGFKSKGERGYIGVTLTGGGVNGAGREGREDAEWVGDGVGGTGEYDALAVAK